MPPNAAQEAVGKFSKITYKKKIHLFQLPQSQGKKKKPNTYSETIATGL